MDRNRTDASSLDVRSVSHHPFTGTNGHRHQFDLKSEISSASKSIVVDVDATADAQHAFERAVRMAQACGARLRIVDVVPGTG